jgi:hypothetical protein
MNNKIDAVVTKINELHHLIENTLWQSVMDAKEIGRLLTAQKEVLRHGDFLPWIQANCCFSERTARNYMAIFKFQCKLANVADLHDAYKQIESLEEQERWSESQLARQRIDEFNSTGKKPEGWRRGTDDKLAEEVRNQQERLKVLQEELKQEVAEEQARRKASKPEPVDFTEINKIVGKVVEQAARRAEFKERIRISHEGKDDQFAEALMDYLDELPDDSRRIEACYNIIKVAKGVANQLQQATA